MVNDFFVCVRVFIEHCPSLVEFCHKVKMSDNVAVCFLDYFGFLRIICFYESESVPAEITVDYFCLFLGTFIHRQIFVPDFDIMRRTYNIVVCMPVFVRKKVPLRAEQNIYRPRIFFA